MQRQTSRAHTPYRPGSPQGGRSPSRCRVAWRMPLSHYLSSSPTSGLLFSSGLSNNVHSAPRRPVLQHCSPMTLLQAPASSQRCCPARAAALHSLPLSQPMSMEAALLRKSLAVHFFRDPTHSNPWFPTQQTYQINPDSPTSGHGAAGGVSACTGRLRSLLQVASGHRARGAERIRICCCGPPCRALIDSDLYYSPC